MNDFIKQYQKVPIEEYPNEVESNPMVSVCVQTYQHANYIAACLDGMLMQKINFQFEILLGEDASTDCTRKICLEYAKKYTSNIRLFLHSRENNIKKSGQSTGKFNFLYNLYNARGKYIALCEGDDYWTDPYKLQKQVDFLEKNPDYGLVASDIVLVNEHNNIISDNGMVLKQRAMRKFFVNVFDLLEINLINTPTVCVRNDIMKELVNRIERENLWYIYDYWFWLNIGIKHKIRIFEEKVAAYRIHSQGISRQSGFLSKRTPLVRYEIVMELMYQQQNKTRGEKQVLSGVIVNLLLNKNLNSSKKLKLWKKLFFIFNGILFYIFVFVLQKAVKKLSKHK